MLGLDRGSDAETSERDLRRGIDVLEQSGNVVWSAHAREDLGRWLVGEGRTAEGMAFLDAARAAYEAIGAARWVERVQTAYAGAEV